MKRKGYFLLLALLCASALQAQFRRGDVNGDLNVDVADISTILDGEAGAKIENIELLDWGNVVRDHTVTTAAEHGEDGTYNLAVLIANQSAAKSQMGVYHRGQDRVEFVQNKKYSAKSGDFLRFLLYLCHVIDDFCLS